MFPFRVVWVNTLPSFKVHHFQATAKMLLSLQRHTPAPESIVYDLSIPPTSISDDIFRNGTFRCTVNKPFSRPGHFGSSLKCLFSHCYLGEFCVVSPLTSTTAYDAHVKFVLVQLSHSVHIEPSYIHFLVQMNELGESGDTFPSLRICFKNGKFCDSYIGLSSC